MTIKRAIKNNLTIEELGMVVIAMDLRPSIQRAVFGYIHLDQSFAEIEARHGVSKGRLHYHLKNIKTKFVRG